MRGQILAILVSIFTVTFLCGCSQVDEEMVVSERISTELVSTSSGELKGDSKPVTKVLSDIELTVDQVDNKETETSIVDAEEMLVSESIDEWATFEKALNEVKTLEELFGLYEANLDGVYANSYILKLSEYYRRSNTYDFIDMLSQLDNLEHSHMIAEDLSSAIYGLDKNIYFTGIFSTEICTLLAEDTLSQKQTEIAEILLSYAPDLVKNTPHSENNIFGSSAPLLWACPDGEMDNYGGGCSWYCSAIIPDIFATSTLKSEDGRYDAVSAYDFNLKTAWSEGVEGHGIGETITIVVPGNQSRLSATSIEIVNGYVKTDSTWVENGRVRKLRVSVDGEYVGDIHLEDSKAIQKFEIGEYALKNPSDLTVTLSILDVYRGTKYEDTLISELTIDGIGDH